MLNTNCLQEHIDSASSHANEIITDDHNSANIQSAILSLCAALQLIKSELLSQQLKNTK